MIRFRDAVAAAVAFALGSIPAAAQRAPAAAADTASQSVPQLIENIERKHPVTFYVLAKRLFEGEQKDEAVFWFYAGQIRYRAYLKHNPRLDPSGEPALFASLSEVIGRPINEYAFGHLPSLAAAIDRALAWDAAHADPYAPKGAGREEVVNGLRAMKAQVLATAADIRKQRAANGLENR
jgi:hypothetical protein